MKDIGLMTNAERARLENLIARALQTQRRCIRIDKAHYLPNGEAYLRVLYLRAFPYWFVTDGERIITYYRETLFRSGNYDKDCR